MQTGATGDGAGGPQRQNGALRGEEGSETSASYSAAETELGDHCGDGYRSYGISVTVSDRQSRGDSPPADLLCTKGHKSLSWRRKAMSLINPELHKEGERVREEINEGESLLCFILSLLI